MKDYKFEFELDNKKTSKNSFNALILSFVSLDDRVLLIYPPPFVCIFFENCFLLCKLPF